MAEATQFTFTHQDVVKALIKAQGIHEGRWQLILEFSIAGANFGESKEKLNPTLVVPITGVGIIQTSDENNLTVDATEVNPRPPENLPGTKSEKAPAKRSSTER